MADTTTAAGFLLNGEISNVVNFLGATAALGTAAMGLVDASKAFCGGPSNFGFRCIAESVKPFLPALSATSAAGVQMDVLRTLRANWINGVAKADQKAKAKALIHLGLNQGSAAKLALAAGVDPQKLQSLAQKTANGQQPSQDEINVLGQFDVALSAVLDAAYERGDQQYRNACKLLAMVVSTILGGVGGWFVYGNGSTPTAPQLVLSLLVGLSATPLAPVSKDLVTSLQAAAAAVGAVKR
jgi:hypothetical protein